MIVSIPAACWPRSTLASASTSWRAKLEDDSGPLLLSPFVLAELDYLLLGRVGPQAERALDEVTAGAYDLVPFGPGELPRPPTSSDATPS